MTRVEHHRGSVHRHIDTAGTVDDFEINRDTGPDFELVSDPEPAIGRICFAGDDGAIDFGFQIGAVDWREILRLPQRGGAHNQNEWLLRICFFEFIIRIP